MKNQNSESTESSSPCSTATNRTDATTRDTHLDRLEEVVWLLGRLCPAPYNDHNEREAKRLNALAASVRWAIEQEKKRS